MILDGKIKKTSVLYEKSSQFSNFARRHYYKKPLKTQKTLKNQKKNIKNP
jgi:hypothetical protein